MSTETHTTTKQIEVSDKKYVTAVILSGVFGVMGIHHFYVERWGMGIFDFGLFIAFFYFWLQADYVFAIPVLLVDLVHTVFVTYLLFVGKYKDGSGKLIVYPGQKI